METDLIVDQSTLKKKVYEYLRSQILAGELAPSKRLVVPDIAERLGVSLTPVREAISQLSAERYVVTLPRKGTFVRDVTVQEMIESYEILGVLESHAMYEAATRISKETLAEINRLTEKLVNEDALDSYMATNWKIHELIMAESGNQSLLKLTNHLREEVTRFRYISLIVDQRLEQSKNEHRQILEALKKGEPENAAKVMKEHRNNTLLAMLDYIKTHGKQKLSS